MTKDWHLIIFAFRGTSRVRVSWERTPEMGRNPSKPTTDATQNPTTATGGSGVLWNASKKAAKAFTRHIPCEYYKMSRWHHERQISEQEIKFGCRTSKIPPQASLFHIGHKKVTPSLKGMWRWGKTVQRRHRPTKMSINSANGTSSTSCNLQLCHCKYAGSHDRHQDAWVSLRAYTQSRP